MLSVRLDRHLLVGQRANPHPSVWATIASIWSAILVPEANAWATQVTPAAFATSMLSSHFRPCRKLPDDYWSPIYDDFRASPAKYLRLEETLEYSGILADGQLDV